MIKQLFFALTTTILLSPSCFAIDSPSKKPTAHNTIKSHSVNALTSTKNTLKPKTTAASLVKTSSTKKHTPPSKNKHPTAFKSKNAPKHKKLKYTKTIKNKPSSHTSIGSRNYNDNHIPDQYELHRPLLPSPTGVSAVVPPSPQLASFSSPSPSADASPKKWHLFSWHSNPPITKNNSGKEIAILANNTVVNAHSNAYQYGGNYFDPRRGIYKVDCSSYVDHVLNIASPRAYSVLAHSTGSYRPTSEHYYNFLTNLNRTSAYSYGNWNKIEAPQQLQAGDILVFRYKNMRGRSSGGHVMLVMDKAVVANTGIIQVKVADSASTGHSADTRGPRASGIGIGTLLLKINPRTGKLDAFAWRVGSPWNNHVNIAMGRPIPKA